ncbi:MAG: ComEC family competence protein [Patescibacteria group bacterium]|nr:ComEC family competence protein [Patescibacteria group bacterium]
MVSEKIPAFRIFTLLALFFLFSITIASFVNIDFDRSWTILLTAMISLILAGLFNLLYKNFILAIFCFAFFALFLGIGHYSLFDSRNKPELTYDKEVMITGKIIKKPEIDFKSQKVVIQTLNDSDLNLKRPANIQISLPHYPAYEYGDIIKLKGKVEKPGIISGFDYGRYLKKSLIFGVVNQPKNIEQTPTELSVKEKTIKSLYSVSTAFEKSLNQILPEPHASLAAGLILGIKRNIPDYFNEALSVTGLTHIIALSGYNITIILVVLGELLLGYLNRKQVFAVGALIAIGFVILTGAASSVVRAAIFSLMVIFGKTIGRQADFTNLILLAAVIMLILNPFLFRSDIGFQLSFLAFAGIIYLSPIIQKLFEKDKYKKIPNFIKNPLTETLSAQIMVAPLILTAFGRFSLISPVANVLVLWIVPLSMGLAFLAGLGGIIFYPLGKALSFFLWPCLEFIIKIVMTLSKIPFASFEIKSGLWAIGLMLYLLIACYFTWLAKKLKVKIL